MRRAIPGQLLGTFHTETAVRQSVASQSRTSSQIGGVKLALESFYKDTVCLPRS